MLSLSSSLWLLKALSKLADVSNALLAPLRNSLIFDLLYCPQNKPFTFNFDSHAKGSVSHSIDKLFKLFHVLFELLKLHSGYIQELLGHIVIDIELDRSTVITKLNKGIVFEAHDAGLALETLLRM